MSDPKTPDQSIPSGFVAVNGILIKETVAPQVFEKKVVGFTVEKRG